MQSLAVKYRPKTFDDVTEQASVKTILCNQIETNTIKNAYLFCGGAGTGKTTCARIFASVINNNQGEPIELDAASNNSVEDMRKLTEQAQTKSIDSEYKVFIIDECHSLSNQAWQAALKTLEEPPAKSIFIFCTTNPEKIPATILSRVQRYNFQRISQIGICRRLELIYQTEAIQNNWKCEYEYKDALEYIAKVAEGGMRDAITMLDKCLSYSEELNMANVVSALGIVDYSELICLTNNIYNANKAEIIQEISSIYASGMDLKLFMKQYFEFVLELSIYKISKSLDSTRIPSTYEDEIAPFCKWDRLDDLLKELVDLQSEIKWEQNPKAVIIARLLLFL